jgi:hypothetical protein
VKTVIPLKGCWESCFHFARIGFRFQGYRVYDWDRKVFGAWLGMNKILCAAACECVCVYVCECCA